jgi:hypothetical protein
MITFEEDGLVVCSMLDEHIYGLAGPFASIDIVSQKNVNWSDDRVLLKVCCDHGQDLVQQVDPPVNIPNRINSQSVRQRSAPTADTEFLVKWDARPHRSTRHLQPPAKRNANSVDALLRKSIVRIRFFPVTIT